MTATEEILRRPSQMLSRVHEMIHPRKQSHGGEIGGILLLALAIGIFVWVFPELRRYARISRM